MKRSAPYQQPSATASSHPGLRLSALALAVLCGVNSSYLWAAPGDGGSNSAGSGGSSGSGGSGIFGSGASANTITGAGGNGVSGGGVSGGNGGTAGVAGAGGNAGGNGSNGGDATAPGGGGGGGSGMNTSGVSSNGTIQGGNGGNGGSGTTGAGGGGGGNGAMMFSGGVIDNQGSVIGGNGGNGGNAFAAGSAGGGGGGGHGVSGGGMTINNAGIITAGSGGSGGSASLENGARGSDGAAVQFTAGSNALNLLSGSVINGVVWLMDGSSATITATVSSSMTGGVLLGTGTALTLATPQDLAIAGSISGAGSLTKTGAGALSLTGINTYSGATTLSAGTLRAGASGSFSSASAFTLASGTTLELNGFDQSLGSLAGSGTVSLGGGILTIGGNNTSTTFIGAIAGNGALRKAGSGTLILDDNFSSITGGTQVLGGSMIVGSTAGNSATLSGSVTVANSARLGGHGSIIGNVTLDNGATLAPGNSIGTLNVIGNVTFDAGSTLEIEANPDGTSDRLIATGAVDLGSSTLSILGGAGTWALSTNYSLIQAGSRIGTFSTITSDLAFLTPTVSYSATGVDLTLARNDISFATMARTNNQRGVAQSLSSGLGGPLVTAVTGLATGQTGAAFDSLSGEFHASARSALFDDSGYMREAISQRLYSGAANEQVLHRDAASGLTFWLQSYGSWSETDGDSNAADLDRDSRGTFIGADLPLDENWRAGVLLGYGNSDLDVNNRDSSADVDSSSLAAYLGGQWDAVNLRLGVGRTWSQVDSKRNVQVGSLEETVKAGYDATTTQVFGELGYALHVQNLALEPYVGLAHVEVDSDGFREHGGATALRGDSEKDRINYASLGLRASAPLGQLAGRALSLQSAVAWQHAFDQPASKSHMALSGFDSFTVEGVPVAEDSALLRLGLDLQLAPQASIDLSYAGQVSDDSRDHGVRLGVAIAW